ncbi:MAG TPA: ribulose-phosphate 3-epimerase [Candidatus Hydrogenedentes bacterium]|nr:MAG: Ribulose-phosphate 3-epimerase [Candidatus Hydrogenedentes bacterium ADurb.Bin179]HOH30174.1 ribulose-phosphate 3-epimerase [Candidatus Hydrogenedentota bacterium]
MSERIIKVSPSLLACDFSRLGEEIRAIAEAGADMIHCDIMDGHFVPNITFGPPVLAKLRSICHVPLDVHLMIERPEDYVESFVDAGADIITIQIEATRHPHRLIRRIQDMGCKAGIVLNPGTPEISITYLAKMVDMVLVMSVNPGFGGQSFIPEMLTKIRNIRDMIGDVDLEVDGGIDENVAPAVVDAGANVLVAGSYIFNHHSYHEAVQLLKAAGNP